MKYFKLYCVCVLFLAVGVINAQAISKEWRKAFEEDDFAYMQLKINNDNINKCYEIGNKPYNLLSIAIKMNATDIFKYLVDQKADLNFSCSSKNAILYAAKYGKLEMLKMLVENGADLVSKVSNKSALDYAKKYQQTEIEAYLLSL